MLLQFLSSTAAKDVTFILTESNHDTILPRRSEGVSTSGRQCKDTDRRVGNIEMLTVTRISCRCSKRLSAVTKLLCIKV